MKSVAFLSFLLLVTSFPGHAQRNQSPPASSSDSKLITVINRANWCTVCKANGQRFEALLRPYIAQGVSVYINDLTNDTTRAVSKLELQNANVYKAVTTRPQKGIGHLLKSCGLAKDKKRTEVSGVVTFIDPTTHKQLKQLSIATPDDEMKVTIENLLK